MTPGKKKTAWLSVLLLAILLFLFQAHLARLWQAEDDIIRTTGTVEGEEVNISSKIQGRIRSLCCSEGTAVHKGDVLVRLANEDLQAQVRLGEAALEKAGAEAHVASSALQNSQAGIDTAAADIRAAEADVQKAAAHKKDAARHLQQMRLLHEKNAVARESFDSATTALEAAEAAENAALAMAASARARHRAALSQKKMAENELLSAEAGVRQAEADLAYRKATLVETEIISPIAGTVVYAALKEGEAVSPGLTILTLVDLSRLTARIDIDETRLSGLRLGNRALIRAAGNPDQVAEGVVAAINPYADFATQKDVRGGRQDIKTFRVTIAFSGSDARFSPGMTVSVELARPAAEGGHGRQ